MDIIIGNALSGMKGRGKGVQEQEHERLLIERSLNEEAKSR